MTDKTFFKNVGLTVSIKALTLGAVYRVEYFCVFIISSGINAAPYGFGVIIVAIAHPKHCLEDIKGDVILKLHAVYTLTITGSSDAAA
jgi:hypothetical protein